MSGTRWLYITGRWTS